MARATCNDCAFAEWTTDSIGRVKKAGRCTWLTKHPLDLRMPAAFYWYGTDRPVPQGGYIERHVPHERQCIFKSGK
jgi:hypothetical protein